MSISVGGLASGLDTNSIISSLVAIEQAKVTREQQKKTNAEDTLAKFNELETRLANLQAKAKTLDLPDNFNVFQSLSNYDEYASISGGEGATAGQYELVVYELATTHKVASDSFTAVNTAMSLHDGWKEEWGESVTINLSTSAAAQKTDSTKTEVQIVINASDTLKDIVNKINAAEGTGVQASLMTMANGDNRLILTAVDTGTAGFYMTEEGTSTFLQDVLGIVDYTQSQATSGNALLTKTGVADAATTTFDQIDTGLGKNTFNKDEDSFGIQIGGEWFTIELYDEEKGDYRTIQEALDIINSKIAAKAQDEVLLNGESDFTGLSISLNNSGEIVLNGAYDNPNFDYDKNGVVAIEVKIGAFNDDTQKFDSVKKDMGKFTIGNVFNENNEISKGQNAFYTIDGMAINSQSNTDDGTIVGTSFTLKKADPDITVKVSLELDYSSLVNKINEFIEEFNSLLKFIDENSKSSIEETKGDDGRTTSTRKTGAFTGDSNISSLRDNLKRMLTGTINEISGVDNTLGYSTVYSSVSRLGIMTEKDGYLSVDTDKLTKALKSDYEGVRKLFTANSFSDTAGFSVGRSTKNTDVGTYSISFDENGDIVATLNGKKMEATLVGNNLLSFSNGLSIEIPSNFKDGDTAQVTFSRGIASQISNFVEKAKDSVDGYFKKSKETYQKRIDEIQKRVDQLQIRVDNYNTRLVNQYAALERALSNLQTQSSSLLSALG